MNANELADLLEVDSWYKLVTREEIATMLRQQQEQIENLKQWERRHLDIIEKQQAEIETLKKDNKELHAIAQRMAMAESDARKSLQWFKDAKERQSEPVAWMVDSVITYSDDIAQGLSEESGKPIIPLYTHPVKELTDEEILCLWDYWSGEIPAIDILDFADKYRRAILNEKGIIEWHQEYCKKMNEEDAKKVDTYKSQNNNQIDTYRYKELTDEEILEICDLGEWHRDEFAINFARAILRKAQEK